MTESTQVVTKPSKTNTSKNSSCSVCNQTITKEESIRHDGKCQICWTRQLTTDLDEMFGEELDIELILKSSEEKNT